MVDGEEVVVDYRGAPANAAWSGQFVTFPLGTISLASSNADISLARQSLTNFLRVFPDARQGNSFVHTFASAARVASNPRQLLNLWENYLINTTANCIMYPSGMVLGCGGTGFENVGGTAFVNEMLIQSHDGIIHLFPALPMAMAASFSLRVVGGFRVSASVSVTGDISDILIISPASRLKTGASADTPSLCKIMSPWIGGVYVNGKMQRPV